MPDWRCPLDWVSHLHIRGDLGRASPIKRSGRTLQSPFASLPGGTLPLVGLRGRLLKLAGLGAIGTVSLLCVMTSRGGRMGRMGQVR